jgi:antitoxin YefM
MLVETFTNTRNNLKAVLDRVVASRAPVKISRQRGEAVVLISESEWESIEETLHLLSSPKNASRLAESIAQLDAGKGHARELIEP